MLKIGHEGPNPSMGWYVEQDGTRIQYLNSLSFSASVNNIPMVTLEVFGLDVELDINPTTADLLVKGSCVQCGEGVEISKELGEVVSEWKEELVGSRLVVQEEGDQ